MEKNQLTLQIMDDCLSICKLDSSAGYLDWAWVCNDSSAFISVTRTKDELSIVCPERLVPRSVQAEYGWKGLKVKGQLDFSLTGILSSIAKPLADNEISIFAISTYNTDYILIKQEDIKAAVGVLSSDFHIET